MKSEPVFSQGYSSKCMKGLLPSFSADYSYTSRVSYRGTSNHSTWVHCNKCQGRDCASRKAQSRGQTQGQWGRIDLSIAVTIFKRAYLGDEGVVHFVSYLGDYFVEALVISSRTRIGVGEINLELILSCVEWSGSKIVINI